MTGYTPQAQTDYLKKSKHQKTTAWILLGSGATLILTGIIIPKGEMTHEGFWPTYKNDGLKNTLGLGGLSSMIVSVPFFIASSKNKKRASSLSLKNEPVQEPEKNGLAYHLVPSIQLKLSL